MSKLRTAILHSFIAISFAFNVPAEAQTANQDDDARQAIARQAAAFVAAFRNGDAASLARFWAPEGDYVDLEGRVLTGREAIAADFADFFAENKGLDLRIEMVSIRFPSPDLAIEEGVTSVLGPEGSLPSRARYTNVLVHRNGEWLLWSVRESPYIPPSNYEHLRSLEWIIGEWVEDREGEHLMHVTFEWTQERNFILGRRSVVVGGTLLDNGTERIGWDAAARLIRSWSFEEDGGFGEGTWVPEGSTWTTRVSSVLSSGGLVTAKTVITRVGPDSLTWQMKERVVNGKSMPDTPVVKIKRIG